MIRKAVTLFFFLCLIQWKVNAQFSDRFFNRMGQTLLTEYFVTPNVQVSIDNATYNANYSGYSLVTLAYQPRYNIVEPKENLALSVDVGLAMGVGLFYEKYVDNTGSTSNIGNSWIHFTLPVMLKLNYGAGSTYDAMETVGLNVGFGFQAIYTPLFMSAINVSDLQNKAAFYMQPVIGFGGSWWSGDRFRTINLSGWPPSGSNNSFYVKLEFIKTFDY
jgi:hypothetical protein